MNVKLFGVGPYVCNVGIDSVRQTLLLSRAQVVPNSKPDGDTVETHLRGDGVYMRRMGRPLCRVAGYATCDCAVCNLQGQRIGNLIEWNNNRDSPYGFNQGCQDRTSDANLVTLQVGELIDGLVAKKHLGSKRPDTQQFHAKPALQILVQYRCIGS